MTKKKIGLLLAYKNTNYGAQLQAWATQYVLESIGFETEIIEYKNRRHFESLNIDRGVLTYLLNSYRNKKLRERTRRIDASDKIAIENKKKRECIYKDFILRRLHNITYYTGMKELLNGTSSLYAVMIGSDQKWLPGACYSKLSSLSFVPCGVRRISYATSLGVSDYPKYCRHSSCKMWRAIDFLSVREEQGAKIIRQVCDDVNVSVVVDPTYLISEEEWKKLVPEKKMFEKKYVLCYFLGNDDEAKKGVRRYADENGLKLVSILSNESLSDLDKSFADELVTSATPEDFINWIRGAEIVFTDSFHGLTFSVINQKQFFVYYRKRDDAKQSRNSRIDNILAKWHLESRLLTSEQMYRERLREVIDYNFVESLVSKERNKSMEFLNKALAVE